MALALNTSDPLYSALTYLFAVDDDNTVKELKAGLALTVSANVLLPNSGSPSTTAPLGRSFRTVGNGAFNFYGVTFDNQVVPTTAPVSVFVAFNQYNGSSGARGLADGGPTYVGPGLVANASGQIKPFSLRSSSAVQFTSGNILTGARTIAFTRNGNLANSVFVYLDGSIDANFVGGQTNAGGQFGYANAGASFNAIGGIAGQGWMSLDIVYFAVFVGYTLTADDVERLHDSLTGDNAFALIEGGASGSVMDAIETGVDSFVATGLLGGEIGGGGEFPIVGAVAATESGVDVFAATGELGEAAGVSGALVGIEVGSDTVSVAGQVHVAGTFAAGELGADTFAASGDAIVVGTLTAQETGADTAAATGKVLVAGTLNAAETGADTASVTGLVLVAGTLSAAEAGTDTFSASGAGQAAGTLAAVESGTDTITAAGQIVVSGALSASEAGSDTWAATGAVRISGSFSASESGTDTFAATGEQPAVTGALAASEIGVDGFAAVGIVPAIGSFDLLEAGHDSLSGAGQIIVAGILCATETGQDTFIATPAGSISGVMAAIEAADTFAATGHCRAPHGARRAGYRGYATQTMGRRPVQTMRRPRQTG